MILVATDDLPATDRAWLEGSWLEGQGAGLDTAVIFGGTAAVSSEVASAIEAAMGG